MSGRQAGAAGAMTEERDVAERQVIPPWTFLTNHGHVLVAIGRDPGLRQREIAQQVGITQGAVTRILAELEEAGYVTHERIGRRNRYTIHADAHLRHPLESGATVETLLALSAIPPAPR